AMVSIFAAVIMIAKPQRTPVQDKPVVRVRGLLPYRQKPAKTLAVKLVKYALKRAGADAPVFIPAIDG
ncbi:MAG: hypothetical protein WBN04_06035, partial [Paracoccaceae bacterium]